MKLALVQMDCVLGDVPQNVAHVRKRVREASAAGAELVVFPECALTGYGHVSRAEARAAAEPLEGRSATAIAEVCRETGIHAIVGFLELAAGRLYNAAMVVGPRGIVGSHRKVHVSGVGVDEFLDDGEAIGIFGLPVGRVGVEICYDLGFPETARVQKLLGAQIVVAPVNWSVGSWRNPTYVVPARALENHLIVAVANRVGKERGYSYIGRSCVVDQLGDPVKAVDHDHEAILYADVDVTGSDENAIDDATIRADSGLPPRGQGMPSLHVDRLADRRPDCYGNLVSPLPRRAPRVDAATRSGE